MTADRPDAAALTEQVAAALAALAEAERETGKPEHDGTIPGAYAQGLRDAQIIVRETLATPAAATPPTASHDETALTDDEQQAIVTAVCDEYRAAGPVEASPVLMSYRAIKTVNRILAARAAASHDETALREAIRAGLREGWRDDYSTDSVVTVVTRHVVDFLTARAAAAPDTGAGDEGLRARIKALADTWAGEVAQGRAQNPGGHSALSTHELDLNQLRAALTADTTSPDGAP